jgi:hypothetical protein
MSEQDQQQPSLINLSDHDVISREIEEGAQKEAATAEPNELSAEAEKKLHEADRLKIENQGLRDALKEAKDLHGIRKEYIGKLFGLIQVWLIIVVIFLILSAFIKQYFTLSDSVIIAFITSTTVSVLGLFVLVAKWLYPSSQKDVVESRKDSKE